MTGHGEERTRHPESARLEVFFRGELPRAEAQAVVRHLLTGCSSCRRITGRLWRLGDEPILIKGGNPFMSDIEAARTQLRDTVRELEGIRLRLLGIKTALLPSPGGAGRLQEEEPPSPEAEIRTVIECVLHDSLEPAIEDLRDVAASPAVDSP